MSRRTAPWFVVSALLALVAVAPQSADAKPRKRRHPRFATAPAPSKGRTPALDSTGAPAGDSREVAGAALDGASRQDVLTGGAAIVLSSTRALVANPYRGLAVVDVTDPDAPTVVGSVPLDGSADRVFVDGSTALVVSRVWQGAGGSTTVTVVDLSDEAHPAIVGSTSVDGDLSDVAISGGDLIVVTSDWGWGPYPMLRDDNPLAGIAEGAPGAAKAAKRPRRVKAPADGDAIAPDFWMPWRAGSSTVRVARIVRGTDGAPEAAGVLDIEGSLTCHAIDGDDVALAVDTSWNTAYVQDGLLAPGGGLTLVDVDASSAPERDGAAAIDGLAGVTSMSVASGVARLVGWTGDGAGGGRLLTYALGDTDPALLASLDLPVWPTTCAFTADRFAFTSSMGDESFVEPGVPDMDPRGAGNTPGTASGTASGPQTRLWAVHLGDPSSPALGTPIVVGDGWAAGMHAVDGGVVVTTTSYDTEGRTHVARFDLADASTPAESGSVDLPGAAYPSHALGDLLLFSGGTWTESGGYAPQVVPVSAPAGGGLTAGAAIDAPSWISSAAWSSPIVAVASVDTLSLVDLTDLSAPATRGSVRLAANVADVAILGDTTAACLVTDYVGGAIEIRTVALPAANVLDPLDTITVGTGDARLFRDGSTLYVLATEWSTGRGRLTVVDASNPAALRARGSLDLASYPGQAFLVNGSMVLLREAWSLVETDEESGKTRSAADPFGRCPVRWTRDELSAVLDVIDLSDLDAPRAATRRRLRWDSAGEAVLRGSTLYVPSYRSYGWSEEGYEIYVYGVRSIGLADPAEPDVGPLVAVPGSLVGAADDAGRVLTMSWNWDDADGEFSATMHMCDLTQRDWRDRVVAERSIAGSPGAVVTGADHAYVTAETWSADTGESSSALRTVALADLAETDSQEIARSAWSGTVAGGHLFLRSWGWTGAIDAYDLTDPAHPAFAAAASVDGVGTTVGVASGRAWVPAGYRGLLGFSLSE